jgi:tetratricopeptide (TPR) repeat protein
MERWSDVAQALAALRRAGDLEGAHALLDEHQARAEGAGHDELLGKVWFYRGIVLDDQGELHASISAFERARDLDRRVYGAESEAVADCLSSIGLVARKAQKWRLAADAFRDEACLRRTLGQDRPAERAVLQACQVTLNSGDFEDAIHLAKSLTDSGSRPTRAWAFVLLSETYRRRAAATPDPDDRRDWMIAAETAAWRATSAARASDPDARLPLFRAWMHHAAIAWSMRTKRQQASDTVSPTPSLRATRSARSPSRMRTSEAS